MSFVTNSLYIAQSLQIKTVAPDCFVCALNQFLPTNTITCQACPTNSVVETQSKSEQCDCATGYTGNHDTCAACGVGTYKPETGSGTCTACGAGKYNGNSASVAESACEICTGNSWSAAGAGACTDCHANSEAEDGSDEADDCKCVAGYDGSTTGQCAACQVGKYKASSGAFIFLPSKPLTGDIC